MGVNFSQFQLEESPETTDYVVGYSEAIAGGERRYPVSSLHNFTEEDRANLDSWVSARDNNEYVKRGAGNRTLYLDVDDGDDNNDGLSVETPVKSWGKITSLLGNVILNGSTGITLNAVRILLISPLHATFELNNIQAGHLVIESYDENNPSTITNLHIYSCKGIILRNLRITAGFSITKSSNIKLENIEAVGVGEIQALLIDNSNSIIIENFTLVDHSIGNVNGIKITNASHVFVNNATGNAKQTGYISSTGSILTIAGTELTGEVQIELKETGGQIFR